MTKRYLGQHFLINRSAIKKIIDALDLEARDQIIEIGPGRGALTIPLIRQCKEIGCRVLAIEKDARLVDELKSYARAPVDEFKNLEIIRGDALRLVNSLTHKLINWKLVGNIPYYITGRLLRILSELPSRPKLIVLTIQKEVAERIVAKPPRMNLLAAITQFWAEPEIVARLKQTDFSPPPKVDSAIIRLNIKYQISPIRQAQSENIEDSEYYKFIKILFKQPRKTVFNNLKSGLKSNTQTILKILKKQGLSGQERPQDLNLELLIKLAVSFA